ncbi:MAG: hypothetical protein HYU51_15945 [Candidatus Rokubacteria bacterium]|nr:hypothetical protein [Candidatus Rokubacteria bacterium]
MVMPVTTDVGAEAGAATVRNPLFAVPPIVALLYLLTVTVLCVYVPWRNTWTKADAGYGFLWAPPHQTAAVDPFRIVLALVAVTSGFLVFLLARSLWCERRRRRPVRSRPSGEVTNAAEPPARKSRHENYAQQEAQRWTAAQEQPGARPWKRWIGWYLSLAGLYALWNGRGLTVSAVAGVCALWGLRWVLLNPPADGYLIANAWGRAAAAADALLKRIRSL